MNLSVRLAGLFGTSVFLLTAMPGFFKQIQPYDVAQMATDTISGVGLLETMALSLGGAIGAGIIGYTMGDILTHPDTRRSKKKVYIKKQVKEFDIKNILSDEISADSPLYEAPSQVPADLPPLSAPPSPPGTVPPESP